MKKFMAIALASVMLTGCYTTQSSYERHLQNKPKSWAGVGSNMERAQALYLWRLKQRCRYNYDYECLHIDLWSE